MNGVEFNVLISIIIILSPTLTIRSQSSGESKQKKGPGISSCNYHGIFKKKGNKFYLEPIGTIPKECTSIFVEELAVDQNYKLYYTYNKKDDQGFINKLLTLGKPVYVYYGQKSPNAWFKTFGCDGSNEEFNINNNMEGLIEYMNTHPGITGLILNALYLYNSLIECQGFFNNHLASYIKAIKKIFPNLEIGIELVGNNLLDYCGTSIVEMLGIEILDVLLDFYVIDLYEFNYCSPEFRESGTTPVSGDAPYTLTKLHECLNNINIPSEKRYYTISINGAADDDFREWLGSYQRFCTSPMKKLRYCADKTQSFFEKGKFFKKTAAGFIGAYMEYADPKNQCYCDRPFKPFYAILDGFNGSPAPNSCKLIDNRFNSIYNAKDKIESMDNAFGRFVRFLNKKKSKPIGTNCT